MYIANGLHLVDYKTNGEWTVWVLKLERKQCPKELLEIKKKSGFNVVYKNTNFMVICYSKIYVVS